MSIYDELRQDVDGILATFGPVTGLKLSRYADAAPDDVTKPWRVTSAGVRTDYMARGVIIDYPPRGRGGSDSGEEPTRHCYLSPFQTNGVTLPDPLRTDVLYGPDGTAYQLNHIAHADPDGTGAIYWHLKLTTWPQTLSGRPTPFSAP